MGVSHPRSIERVYEAEETIAFAGEDDSLEAAVRFDLVIGDGERAVEAGRTAVVEVRERLPDPEEVGAELGFLFQRLELGRLLRGAGLFRLGTFLGVLFFLNLPQPLLVFGSGAAGPTQEA